jgi:hypothetical protein
MQCSARAISNMTIHLKLNCASIAASLSTSPALTRNGGTPRDQTGANGAIIILFSGDTDFSHVSDWIDRLYGGDTKIARMYRKYMEAWAEQLVERYWREIENLAQALLEHGTIAGDIRVHFASLSRKS